MTKLVKKKTMGAPIKSPKINREAGLAIASELRRIGVNLNQTKHANETQIILEDDLKAIRRDIANIWYQFS